VPRCGHPGGVSVIVTVTMPERPARNVATSRTYENKAWVAMNNSRSSRTSAGPPGRLHRHHRRRADSGLDARPDRGAPDKPGPTAARNHPRLRRDVPRPALHLARCLHRPNSRQTVRYQDHRGSVLPGGRGHARTVSQRHPGDQYLPGESRGSSRSPNRSWSG
jgi:hypothetical protein